MIDEIKKMFPEARKIHQAGKRLLFEYNDLEVTIFDDIMEFELRNKKTHETQRISVRNEKNLLHELFLRLVPHHPHPEE